jgi:hypothetical protein
MFSSSAGLKSQVESAGGNSPAAFDALSTDSSNHLRFPALFFKTVLSKNYPQDKQNPRPPSSKKSAMISGGGNSLIYNEI